MTLVLSATALLDGGGDPFEQWQPLDVSGFALDINPHYKVTTGLDGARITATQIVSNAPSASDTFSNSNSSLQPTYAANGWGGTYRRPSLRFDGIAYYLACASGLTLAGGTNTAFSLYLVGQFLSLPTGSNAMAAFFAGSGSTVAPLWDFFALSGAWKSNKRGDTGSIVGVSGGTSDTAKHVFSVRHSGTSVRCSVDGVSVFSGAQTTGAATMNRMALGVTYGNSAPADWADFLLGRSLGFTAEVGDTDDATIISQLRSAYEI